MVKYKFIISGGGTGGHIYPAIAIADEICKQHPQSECLFVGAAGKMEMRRVPEAGYNIVGLPIRGIQRKFSLKNFLIPLYIIRSLFKSLKIIRRYKPDFVLGTGGYASFPICLMAFFRQIPFFIQEQNFYPGITNKILAKKAKKIFVAYEGLETYFPEDKIIKTGNPIRKSLFQISIKNKDAKINLGLDPSKKTLLILGGSLGAKSINELIAHKIKYFKSHSFQIIWQCGNLYVKKYGCYRSNDVLVYPFIKDINVAYVAADIIISRSGAIAVSELCVVGKPVIFIPSPSVAEDHQTKNAKIIESQNAGVLIREKDLNCFEDKFSKIISSPKLLETLSINIKKMALPNATKQIVDYVTYQVK